MRYRSPGDKLEQNESCYCFTITKNNFILRHLKYLEFRNDRYLCHAPIKPGRFEEIDDGDHGSEKLSIFLRPGVSYYKTFLVFNVGSSF